MANMGRVSIFAAVVLLLRFTLALGNLSCEDLIPEECAFAVSSAGARCVLEKFELETGEMQTDCQTSTIMADRPEDLVESDECIRDCGLERETYGLSTDALMESGFADKLCSPECRNNCPNIIDLYTKLAAGEGVHLPHLCNDRNYRARRLIADPIQIRQYSSEGRSWPSSLASTAAGPLPSPLSYGPAPAPEPSKSNSGDDLPTPIQAQGPTPSPSPEYLEPEPSPEYFEFLEEDFGDLEY